MDFETLHKIANLNITTDPVQPGSVFRRSFKINYFPQRSAKELQQEFHSQILELHKDLEAKVGKEHAKHLHTEIDIETYWTTSHIKQFNLALVVEPTLLKIIVHPDRVEVLGTHQQLAV
jgi:hypothetical protein